MQDLSVKEIVIVCNGDLINGDKNKRVSNFSKDSRTIQNGDFYIGIKGENFDGNDFFEQALNNGAIGCIIEKDISNEIKDKYKEKIIIKVDDSIKSIQKLATYRRNQYSIPVIAVTGSVGKTSTKDIIASVLSQKYNVLKTEGNLNNQIGLPLTLLKLKDHTAVVIEMGMSDFGEISRLSKIAKPTIGVITNIGTSHIGFLGSRENILKAKLEILDGMEEKKIIINNDNDLLNKWGENSKIKIIKYGINNKSEIMAANIIESENGSSYNTYINKKNYLVNVPVGGRHFIENSLCAISIAKELNIDINKAIIGIKEFKLSRNRMDIQTIKDYTIINDTYNASLESIKAVLNYLKNINGNKKIAVLGDVLELENFARKIHEQIGEEVVKNKIDILITVGENAKYIAEKAMKLGLENVEICNNTIEATNYLKKVIEKKDVIILKASHAMKLERILEEIKKDIE